MLGGIVHRKSNRNDEKILLCGCTEADSNVGRERRRMPSGIRDGQPQPPATDVVQKRIRGCGAAKKTRKGNCLVHAVRHSPGIEPHFDERHGKM